MLVKHYTNKILTSSDPEEIMQFWSEAGEVLNQDQVVTLHQQPGVAVAILGAAKKHSARSSTKSLQDGWSQDPDWDRFPFYPQRIR